MCFLLRQGAKNESFRQPALFPQNRVDLPPAGLAGQAKKRRAGGGSGRNAFAARAAYNFMVVDEPEEKTAAKDLQSGY